VKELRDKGLGLATISYDPVETLAGFSKEHGITFPMLSDVGSATIKKYGILNPAVEWALGPDKDDPAVQAEVQKYVSVVGTRPAMLGIPFPGTFILDPHPVEQSHHLLFEVGFRHTNTGMTRLRVFGTAVVAIFTGTAARLLLLDFHNQRTAAMSTMHHSRAID
jgi:hypothetical protein